MKEKQFHGKLPIGRAHELESKKETLPAVEVKNTVRWVNNDMELPFDIREGESGSIGLFLAQSPKPDARQVEVSRLHGRSGILARFNG